MYVIVDDEIWVLSDHLKMDHGRETPRYWTFEELDKAHRSLHKMQDWNHGHRP